MIDKNNFKDLAVYALVIALFILAFFIVKPILSAIIYGLLLAYITFPMHRWLRKKIKNEFISAFIVCLGFFLIIIIILSVIISSLFNQAIDFYFSLKSVDFGTAIADAIPKSLISSEASSSLIDNIKSSASNLIFNFLGKFNTFILNLPSLFLKFAVVIFVFFFSLKDGEKAIEYLKSISPLRKETEEKFFKRFKDVTNSVLLGQILVGIIQGTTAGIGFFIFGVKNPLLLTLLSIIASMIPLGPWLVWLPVNIFMFIGGRTGIAFVFLIYNLFFTSLIDNVVRPFIVSKRTEINTGIIVVGMIGGFFIFGILGFIIGPLILAYVLLLLEIYKKKNVEESIVFKECKEK